MSVPKATTPSAALRWASPLFVAAATPPMPGGELRASGFRRSIRLTGGLRSYVAPPLRDKTLRASHLFANLKEMTKRDQLGSFELMVILVLIRLGDNAYGVPICEELEQRTGRDVAVGSVYAALERLEDKGFVTSELGEPTPERGGRAKKYFHVTARSLTEVRETQRPSVKLWHGLPELEVGTA